MHSPLYHYPSSLNIPLVVAHFTAITQMSQCTTTSPENASFLQGKLHLFRDSCRHVIRSSVPCQVPRRKKCRHMLVFGVVPPGRSASERKQLKRWIGASGRDVIDSTAVLN